jgi:anti-sigma-K factor RskA
MMAYSEDHIALAAEYALGTLDAEERAQAETMMAADKEFAALVDGWDRKLGVLNQMVGSVEPRAEVWDRIRIAVGHSEPQLPLALPQEPQAAVAAEPDAAAATSNVLQFSRAARRWRAIASVATAMAAALVAVVAVQVTNPDLLPAGLRPKTPPPQIVQVQAPATPASGQYVAVLQQKDGTSPAFILTVDAASKNFTVRRVGATPEPGKSYELWLVSDKLQRPRSLGVIGSNDFTRAALAAYDTDTVNKATYAVTVEPEGGSPTGVATGPIVFTGKLIETVPPAPPPR